MKAFRKNSKRYFLASLQAQGLTQSEAYALLRPKVLDQSKPWIFSANVKGRGRVAKPISEQLVDLQHEINRVWALIERQGNDVPADAYSPDDVPDTEEENEETFHGCDDCGRKDAELFHHEESGLSLCDDCISKREEKPQAKAKSKDAEKRLFVEEWKRLRTWIRTQSELHGTNPIDSLDSMRPIQAAREMIDQGISAKMCVHAMTLHWPKATRENAGIEDMDFLSESESHGEGYHKLFDYLRKCALAAKGRGFGVMAIGPAGSGKSYLMEQVAREIRTESHPNGLPYGETPLTPGATRGDLLGRITLEGYVPSQFVEIYSGGGLFNFEEIDAADPSMLIVVNNALASGRLFNSVNGQVYEKHDDFIAGATANTFGLGADAKYTGREKLDLATIDRFRMARVLVDLDESLAEWNMFSAR